jgi:hypothetical protein
MTVSTTPPERIDDQTFRLRWTSSEAAPVPFLVYVNGVLAASWSSVDQTGEITLTIAAGDAPFVEVLDKADMPEIAFPGRVTLQWLAIAGAGSYRVDENIASVWTERKTITDDGFGVFAFLSRWLEEGQTHQFRVVPISTAGNEGTPLSFSIEMVRHPDPPSVAFTYNGAGTPTVTITEV